jgi:hypothetical protein
VSNRAALTAAMPAMLTHEGWWDGWYRHLDTDGTLLDAHRVRTRCEFPEDGHWHYIQHSFLSWEDGREAHYEFGGRLKGERLVWDTERFRGYGWQTHDDTLMLRLDRLDVPGAHYLEMISIAPNGRSRARTWQWFRDGAPWKRTLCDERRIAAP